MATETHGNTRKGGGSKPVGNGRRRTHLQDPWLCLRGFPSSRHRISRAGVPTRSSARARDTGAPRGKPAAAGSLLQGQAGWIVCSRCPRGGSRCARIEGGTGVDEGARGTATQLSQGKRQAGGAVRQLRAPQGRSTSLCSMNVSVCFRVFPWLILWSLVYDTLRASVCLHCQGLRGWFFVRVLPCVSVVSSLVFGV